MPIAYITSDLRACRLQIRPIATPETIFCEIHDLPSAPADVITSLKAIQGSLIASIQQAAAIQRRPRATSVAPLDLGVGAMAGTMASAVHSSERVRGNIRMLVK
jgi:hypothetical protein